MFTNYFQLSNNKLTISTLAECEYETTSELF